MNKDAVRAHHAREDAARPARGTVARLSFGDALEVLKAGGRVRRDGRDGRDGWGDRDVWLVLIRAGNAMHRTRVGWGDMQDCIGMKTAGGKMQPRWVPSQADMLSSDWIEVK